MSVDARVYSLTRAQLEGASAYLAAVQGVAADSMRIGSAEMTAARDEIRALALAYMAVAYSFVSPVDAGVLQDLQTRYKEIGQEPIPLTEAQRRRILALVELGFPRMGERLDTLVGDDSHTGSAG